MTPTDYEKAVLQQIRTDWPPPRFVVRHNIRISGKKSKARRQIDIGVFEAGHSKPFMIVEALRNGDAAPFIDADIPYEEWLAVIAVGRSLFPESSARVLKSLAREHYDDAARYNAVVLLDEAGALETADVDAVIDRECDPEILEFLYELRETTV